MGKFYAVKIGRVPGIFTSWDDCKASVDGYSGAVYKSFKTVEEAASFMGFSTSPEKDASHFEKTELYKSDAKAIEEISGDESTLIAYVDGSYNINTCEYGSGVVFIMPDGSITELKSKGADEEMATMRNVAGEIKASEMAMKYAADNGYKNIKIYHDYEGIAKWCQGLWKTNKEGTKAYRESYLIYSKSLNIEFIKVKGHSGEKYNDMADLLAKEAAGVE